MNINVCYKNNRSEYFEEKVKNLAESYSGEIIREFEFSSGNFEAEFSFKSKDQENSFKKEVIGIAKYLSIDVDFGGSLFL